MYGKAETVALLEQTGHRALAIQCNVADGAAAEAAVKEVEAQLGPIAVLVNNAGIVRDGLAMRMSSEDFRAVLDVNLTGAFLMAQAITWEANVPTTFTSACTSPVDSA